MYWRQRGRKQLPLVAKLPRCLILLSSLYSTGHSLTSCADSVRSLTQCADFSLRPCIATWTDHPNHHNTLDIARNSIVSSLDHTLYARSGDDLQIEQFQLQFFTMLYWLLSKVFHKLWTRLLFCTCYNSIDWYQFRNAHILPQTNFESGERDLALMTDTVCWQLMNSTVAKRD